MATKWKNIIKIENNKNMAKAFFITSLVVVIGLGYFAYNYWRMYGFQEAQALTGRIAILAVTGIGIFILFRIGWHQLCKRLEADDIPRKQFVDDNKYFVVGVAMLIVGVAIFFYIFQQAYRFVTTDTWTIGIVANVASGIGVYAVLKFLLTYHYRDWTPINEGFYDEWRAKRQKQQIILIVAVVIEMLLAFLIPSMTDRYEYYVYNYSVNYLLIATVILHYGICQMVLSLIMRQKLNALMECMTEINRNKLEEALDIERESIEKAKKSEQMKVDLISNVSHDLKTPLTSMIGYIELMKKEELNDTMQDYVEVLSDKSEKLKEMIESLFSLAKASSGNINLNMEVIQMNKLVEQLFADMSGQIERSGLQFMPILSKDDTHFTTDNAHMYRVCQNLVENAIKYSAKGTRVFVKTYVSEGKLGERLFLEITNTAGYLMDFDAETITERFARGDKARSTDGNGLGLAIVSTYTSALGGTFDLNIDYDQFKVTLSFPRQVQ